MTEDEIKRHLQDFLADAAGTDDRPADLPALLDKYAEQIAEPYNGWVNRETWYAFTAITDDPFLFPWLSGWGGCSLYEHAELLKEVFADWTDRLVSGNTTEKERVMLAGLGSTYRIDWLKLASALRDAAR